MTPGSNVLRDRLADRSARVGVIGLGYVGLPLAVEFARAGFVTTGIDLDARKVDAVNRGGASSLDALRHALPPPQALGVAALALGGATGAGHTPRRRRLARPRRLGRRQIFEEHPRDLGRSAALADAGHLQDATAPSRQGDRDEISGPDPPGGLHGLVVHIDFTAVARHGRLATRLEHPRRPEPLIHTDRIERGLHAETVS